MLFRQALPALLFSTNWVCRAFCTAVYDLLKLHLLLFIDIYNGMNKIFSDYHPQVMSMEKLFYNNNAKTVIDVAQARGVITLSAQQNGVQIAEYTPLQVKQSVTGYGRAVKKQVQEMTRIILNLEKIPKPDDTADALAMAICHAHCSGSLLGGINNYNIKLR